MTTILLTIWYVLGWLSYGSMLLAKNSVKPVPTNVEMGVSFFLGLFWPLGIATHGISVLLGVGETLADYVFAHDDRE